MVLAYFMSLFPDCRSMGDASISILQPPAHGELGTGRGSDYPTYGGMNTHSVCNKRRVPSTRLYYTATPGYEGTEVVKVSVAFPDNSGRNYAYVISVR